MGLLKSKLMLRLTLAVSIFGVAVGAVSTLAWFQINTSANNIDQATQTRNLATTATVYQDNNHVNDDPYQITPTPDNGDTLSYDHAKGGKATNYYIRYYTNNEETHSLQMFSNINNNADKAVYYNIAFDENFKIYNASTDAYLGYSNIDSNCQIKGTQFEAQSDDQNDAGRDNIHCLTSSYYDIYVTVDNSGNDRIWIGAHSEVTTSAEMGNETGYYIYGTNADSYSSLAGHNDIKNGIAMYVNAAAETHDLAFYAGLRLSVGDTFYLVSGDSTEPYKEATNDGLLNPEGGNSTNFSFDLETGLITCRVLGYYCIALNQYSKIHMTTWDGMEVDGTTRYTVNNMADQSAQKNNVEKKARRNATGTTSNKTYTKLVFDESSCDWDFNNMWIENLAFSSGYDEDDFEYFCQNYYGTASNYDNFAYETHKTYKRVGDGFNLGPGSADSTTHEYYFPTWLTGCSITLISTSHNSIAFNNLNDLYSEARDGGHSGSKTGAVGKTTTFKCWYYDNYGTCNYVWQSSNTNSSNYTWTTNTVTLSFVDTNGSTLAGITSGPTTPSGSNINCNRITTPSTSGSKTGYTFSKFYYSRTNSWNSKTEINASTSLMVKDGMTIYIVFSLNSHTFNWNFNGATSVSNDYSPANGATVNYGTTITRPSSITKSGYTLSGWSSNATTMPDSNLTLTANWSAKKFNVVFNNNGGSGSITKMSNAQIGTTLTSNNGSMTNGNRAFLGWSLNSGDSLPTIEDGAELTGANADALYAAKDGNNDTTLFAIWGEVHTVTLEVAAAPSGETAPGTLSSYELANVPEGTSITLGTGGNKNKITIGSTTITATPKAQTAQYSYAFDSWTVEDDATSVTGDLTITANFTETLRTYDVTLSRNNTGWGTLSAYTVSDVPYNSTYLVSGNNMLIKNPSGTTIATITPTPDGGDVQYSYDYGSWSSASGTITGEKTLTYTFTRSTNQYTVTINRNYNDRGTISQSSITVDYGTTITIGTGNNKNKITIGSTTITATPAGQTDYYTYSFGSWTKSPNNSTVQGTMTITANFNRANRTYSITYMNQGNVAYDGSEIASSYNSYTYNTAKSLPTGLTRAGSSFLGWFTDSACTAGNEISTVAAGTYGNKTYYAKWDEATGYYAIVGSVKGNWSESGSGAVKVTNVPYSAESVTFEGVSFTNGETWKIKRPDGQTGYWGLSWWSAEDLYQTYSYFSDVGGNDHNISTNYIGVGTYNITLILETGKIVVTPTSLNFHFYQYTEETGGSDHGSTPTSYSGNTMAWEDITLDANYDWHIEGPSSSYIWGYAASNNIKATTNYASYFIQGSTEKDPTNHVWNIKNFYGMTASSIVFDISANTIVVTLESIDSDFMLKDNSGNQIGSTASATAPDGTVTFSGVSLSRNKKWRMTVEGNNYGYSSIGDNVTILGQSKAKGSFFSDSSGYANTVYAGTYTIIYNVVSHTFSVVSCTAINADNFTLYHYYWNGESSTSQTTVNAVAKQGTNSQFTFTVTGNGFVAGYMWHITGPSNDHIWGYKTGGDNISAMDNYGYWFADSNHGLGDGKPKDIKNLYTMSCTVTFDFLTNSIVVSNMTLKASQFTLTTSAGDTIATASASAYNGTVTFTNASLPTATPWQLRVDGNLITYDASALPVKVSILDQGNLTTSNFFYTPKNTSGYIGTGWGGTYTLVYNVTTHQFTSITCSALLSSDIKVVRGSGSETGVAMTSVSNDLVNHTATFTGTTTLFIDETMRFVNTNTATTSGDVSCVHDYYFNNNGQNILSWNLNETNLLDVNTTSHLLHSRVHATITYTFVWYASDTHATFAISSVVETICTKITFTHTEEAGIYLETTTNYTTVNQTKVADWTGSTTRIMMHTTSATIDGHTCYAQEAPIYTAGTAENPVFMRIVVTHSNYFTEVPSGVNKEERIKYLTEFYYVALDNDLRSLGFDSSTPTANDYDYDFEQGQEHEDFHGNGPGAYIVATVNGTWTITYRDDGKVHIEEFTGAATVSTEHEVPYYLIGRGMPGSALRECDFTTAKGINLWTYGGNNSTMPCYVGAYGGNTSSSNVVGSGIHLKKGDKFALASVSKQMLTFASATASDVSGHFTIDNAHKIVTINDSGLYRIYLSGSVGSEQINIEWVSADAESSRNESIISRNGISPISSTGNTLTLGGNLDYSLLDANTTGYIFVVQFDHISTGVAGNMDYTITNNNNYSIKVARKEGTNASAGSYSTAQAIAKNSNYTYTDENTRTITASSTTSTCIRIIIPAKQIRSMISSNNYTFNITISYTFMETTIS